jgi:hypothetical protein
MSPLDVEEKIESLKTLLSALQSLTNEPQPVSEEERGLVRASNISEFVNAIEKIES